MQLPLVPRMCPSPAPWAPAPAADHPLHLRSLRVGAAGSTLLLAVHPLSRGDRRTAARRSRTARCAVEEDEHAKAVQQWVQDVVIGYNFCPYAQPAAAQGHLRVVTSTSEVPEGVLEDLSAEAVRLPQGAGLQLGDLIQLGEQRATIRDTCAGYSASGLPLAMANDADIHRRNGRTIQEDLRSFFMPLAANWTVLELGSYRGYTTRALAETFASVIAVDASEAFLNSNRRYNADRRNIFFVHLHSRVEGLRSLRQNEAPEPLMVAMVDAEHEYASVYRDTNQLLRYFRPSLKYLIFDDFGTDPGVMRAVREFVQSGRLRVLASSRPPHADAGTSMATYSHLGNGYAHQAPLPTTQPPATAPAHMLGPAGSPGSRPFSANPSSPYGSWDQLPAGPVDEDADPDFEEMVSDLRRSFVGWLKKAELETKQHRSELRRGRQAFEEEKLSVWQQFMAEKQREVEKIREDRRHAEEEMATHLRRMQTDIEEARSRISEERQRALRLAAGRGSASVVRELVAVGLSVNDGCRGTGYTPLHLAAAGGHVVVCELLLDALADVHKQVDGITALSLARKMGNMEVEEVIERHVATLLMHDQGNVADEAAQYRRAHVLPRVSAMLSEAVLQAAPFEEAQKPEESQGAGVEQEGSQRRRSVAHEYEKFRQEYGLFEADRQRLANPQLAAESTVDLNVGGTIFETTRSTLVQQSGSFLESLLSGRYQISRDRYGRIFLNRDPDHFRTILNFLRNPHTPPMPRDSAESEALVQEASFYGVHFFPFPLVFAVGGHDGYEHLRAMEVLDDGVKCSDFHRFALCDVEIYDCLRDTWEAGSAMRFARRNCGCCELEGRIYAIGGFDGTRIIDSVEAYDSRLKNLGDKGTFAHPLPTGRSSPMATVNGGKLWVLGGTSGTRLRTVDVFDPRANRWESLKTEMVDARSAGQAANCVHHVFAMGGTDNDHRIHFSAECLDPDDHEARMDFAAAVISDSIMVTGGQNGSVLSSSEFYRPELDEWQAGPSMAIPRCTIHHSLPVTCACTMRMSTKRSGTERSSKSLMSLKMRSV
eukprot:g7397.t3